MQGGLRVFLSHGNVVKNAVLQRMRIVNPLLQPVSFSRYESATPARIEEHGFESTTIEDILKAKGKGADGSWLWCNTEDTVYDAVKSMTQNNVGALVVVKPGEEKSIAGIITERGIYVGDGMVIHFTRGAGHEIGTGTVLDRLIFSSSPSHDNDNPCPRCGDQSRTDGVISSCLDCFLHGGNLYLFEYGVSPAFFLAKARGGTCTLAPSDPTEDVLRRASFLLENGFGGYNLFKNNCEDFAIYCKTGLLVFTSFGVCRSGQATSYFAAASAVVSTPFGFLTTSFSGLALVGYGMYCVSRLVFDIGVRRDVSKIPAERFRTSSALDEPEKIADMPKED